MSESLEEFDRNLVRFGDEVLPGQVEKLHRALSLEALRGVVLATPVRTGRARGNWQVTQRVPARGELDTTDKEGGATIAAGSAQVADAKAFSVTWIANNLPYIERLENGSSKQAPRGMGRITIERLKRFVGRLP